MPVASASPTASVRKRLTRSHSVNSPEILQASEAKRNLKALQSLHVSPTKSMPVLQESRLRNSDLSSSASKAIAKQLLLDDEHAVAEAKRYNKLKNVRKILVFLTSRENK